jgi:predicted transcriptional regulator
MVRRSKLEIFFDILNVVNNGVVKPTRIMYKTNLSWTPLQKALQTLLEGDFITEKQYGKTNRYYITEKGKRTLTYYKRSMNELLPVLQDLRA